MLRQCACALPADWEDRRETQGKWAASCRSLLCPNTDGALCGQSAGTWAAPNYRWSWALKGPLHQGFAAVLADGCVALSAGQLGMPAIPGLPSLGRCECTQWVTPDMCNHIWCLLCFPQPYKRNSRNSKSAIFFCKKFLQESLILVERCIKYFPRLY